MLENGDESHLPKRSEGVHAVLGALIVEDVYPQRGIGTQKGLS